MTLYVFDLDGTVLDTEYAISAITAEVLRERGYDIDTAKVFSQYSGLSFKDKFNHIAADYGRSFDPDDLQNLQTDYDARKKKLYASDGLTLVTGMDQLLSRLGSTPGNTLAIGSSNRVERSQQGLSNAHLTGYFNHRVYGPDLVGGLKKPHPAIYRLAMRDNGFKPSDSVVVDDSEPGIAAGHLAGAFVVAYLDPRLGDKSAEKRAQFMAAGANVVISSFDEFEDAVDAARPAWLLRQPA
jgi:beta-phosphoglucomutase-like phosphatase (HAD superfamily)